MALENDLISAHCGNMQRLHLLYSMMLLTDVGVLDGSRLSYICSQQNYEEFPCQMSLLAIVRVM
jgi:hypothetical protein